MRWSAIAWACLFAVVLTGCKAKHIIVERVRVDSVAVVQHHRDSIYLRDSVSVRDEAKGDTIVRYVERWRTHYKEVVRVDTCVRVRVDSIPYPVEVEVVKYKRPKARHLLFILIAGALLWINYRFFLRS